MIDFGLPWALLLLPAPLLIWWLWKPAPENAGALRVPFFDSVASLVGRQAQDISLAHGLRLFAKATAWILLVIAAAQPQWVGPPQAVATRGRDLMLALDLSGSMATEDFEIQGRTIDRFGVVRAVARQFVLGRRGDRVGLVLFGSRAFLQAPVTPDLDAVVQMLDESEVGLAGRETAMGDAIGLAVKHLRTRPSDERVLVLLSDGASNAGALEPKRAAELAREAGVRIYTIGVGSDQRIVPSIFGRQVVGGNPDLDETTLREVAEGTGGSYFRAEDTQGLLRIYAEIDRLEPTAGEQATVRPIRELFYWPLAIALAIASLVATSSLANEALAGLRWREGKA